MADLLWEIGSEEIPAGYLSPVCESLRAAFEEGCRDANIAPVSVRVDGTPRRVALFAGGLPESQPRSEAEAKGPPASAAFDGDGNPTRAAQAFAERNGVDVSALEVRETPKGPYVFAQRKEGGAPVAELLPAICRVALASVHAPKAMFWGVPGLRFPRPIRSICLLLDHRVVECEIAGLPAGRVVHGHPFLSDGALEVERADWERYAALLEGAHVVLGTDERRRRVRAQVEQELGGPCGDDDLIHEVANLVEWPTALTATFDATFLALPDAVLEAAMTGHQRYFPVRGADGALANRFVVVTNRTGETLETIRDGNQRVLHARLADARFFYELDRKRPLADRIDELAAIGAQKELGSLRDRAERLRRVAQRVAGSDKAPEALRGLDAAAIARASLLAKADLCTEMVGEFPSLQGVVGELYARDDGEPEGVCAAIREHYLPRGLQDALPTHPMGQLLALADKAVAIVEAFALGREPTGSRDQFGVRRASYGLLRLVREAIGAGKVSGLLWLAAESMPPAIKAQAHARRPDAETFVAERLRQWALDHGYPHDTVRACAASDTDAPGEFFARCEALATLRGDPGWDELVTVVDRTKRILGRDPVNGDVSEALFQEDAERLLAGALADARPRVTSAFASREYVTGARAYRDALARPVHRFFDEVFVNADDAGVRRNRLALLRDVNTLFSDTVADLSLIEGAGAREEG